MDEGQREEFMTELYAARGSEVTAKAQLREHLAAQGIDLDGEV